MTVVETRPPGEGEDNGLGKNADAMQALAINTPDSGTPVAVNVAESSFSLPPSAEVKIPDSARTWEQIKAEIHSEQDAQQLDPITESKIALRDNSVGEELIRQSNEAVAAGLMRAVEGARNQDELNQKAAEYLHYLSDQKALTENLGILNGVKDDPRYDENKVATYLKSIARNRKEGGRDVAVISPSGALILNPDDPQYEVITAALAAAQSEFDKRGRVQKARDALYTSRQDSKVRRQNEKYMRDAYRENDEFDARKAAEEEQKRQEELAQKAAEEARKAKEAEDKALAGPSSYKEYADRETAKAVAPIDDEIRQLRTELNRLWTVASRINMLDRKDMATKLQNELNEAYEKRDKVLREAVKKTLIDREKLTDGLREQSKQIYAFQANPEESSHVYIPDETIHPELAALIAGANGSLMGVNKVPVRLDEYDIPHKEGPPTRMQRIVYKTSDPNMIVVEDWDKTSGKLKRQAFMRGDDLLKSERSKLGRKTGGVKLSDEAYGKLGVMRSKDVEADADTTSVEGYQSHVRNLTRAGGVHLDTAKYLADPHRKPKATKSFMQLLRDEWIKAGEAKPKLRTRTRQRIPGLRKKTSTN